jgi:hypothetical protein
MPTAINIHAASHQGYQSCVIRSTANWVVRLLCHRRKERRGSSRLPVLNVPQNQETLPNDHHSKLLRVWTRFCLKNAEVYPVVQAMLLLDLDLSRSHLCRLSSGRRATATFSQLFLGVALTYQKRR